MFPIRAAAGIRSLSLISLMMCGGNFGGGQEQYPKPLIHTKTDHPAARILLLSIDGLHAVDLANWTVTHPQSALARLSAHGVTYTNAHTPVAEPAAGLVSIVTGGTPISTGIVTDYGYDRSLSPPGSQCRTRGAALLLAPEVPASGGSLPPALALDPEHACAPLAPHDLVRVNTIFEVVRREYGRTAWAGSTTVTTDLLRGPSGAGLDDACVVAPAPDNGWGAATTADDRRLRAVLRWIDGKICDGTGDAPVPALFGMSFGGFAAQEQTPGSGYLDAAGTPSEALTAALGRVDRAIGRLMDELRARDLLDSTWIAIISPFGEAPMRPQHMREIPLRTVQAIVDRAEPAQIAHISGGGTVRIWLADASKTAAAVEALSQAPANLGIRDIDAGRRLTLTLNSPRIDPRMPDIVVHGEAGVFWTRSGIHRAMTDGGDDDESTHVALLVSGRQFTHRLDPTWVPTTQLAPLLLRALGLEKFDLHALHREHTPALPGIF